MKQTLGFLLGLSALGATACGPADTTTGTGAGGSTASATSSTTGSGPGGTGGMAAITVVVAPSTSKTLTCETLPLTATVTGTTDQAVTWSVTPDGTGSIDASGKYTAPIQVPTPDSVSIVATSHADPGAKGSASLTLSTTRPGAVVAISKQPADEPGVREHVVAARGAQVYGVFSATDASGSFVYLAASADSGATWGVPVKVNDNAGDVNVENAVVAVDTADPKVVYVAYKLTAGGGFSKSKDVTPQSGGTIVEATSTDGGKTFTNYVLFSGGNGFGNSIDIVSPGAGQVVVSMPDFTTMRMYADGAKGAGFAVGMGDASVWETAGYTSDFTLVKDASTTEVFSYIAQNGGSGETPGSGPRLATDGAGRVCIVYEGVYYGTPDFPTGSDLPYIQCSSDLTKTFSPPLALDTDRAATHFLPTAAFGPNHVVTVVWEQRDTMTVEHTYLAQSADNGKTFGASFVHAPYLLPDSTPSSPGLNSVFYEGSTLWLAYLAYDGGHTDRIIADKSCDGGKTWSRAELTNGAEGAVDGLGYPGIVGTDHGMLVFGKRDADSLLSVYPIE
jgi:hypothetical protein